MSKVTVKIEEHVHYDLSRLKAIHRKRSISAVIEMLLERAGSESIFHPQPED